MVAHSVEPLIVVKQVFERVIETLAMVHHAWNETKWKLIVGVL